MTWGNYDQLKDDIESRHEVSLNYRTADSSSKMFTAWNAGAVSEFDLGVPVPNWGGKFIDAGLVAPLDREAADNYADVYDRFKGIVREQMSDGSGRVYGLPTRFGWYGYSYDSRSLPEDHEKSYEVLFSEEYAGVDLTGKTIVYDGMFKAMAMTAMYLGYHDAFSGTTVERTGDRLPNVKEALIEQKRIGGGYISADSTYIKSFRQANHVAGQSGRNEIVEMQSEGDDWVRMAKPAEGELAWSEAFVVSGESDHPELAWRVANEYLDPELGAKWAEENATPCCNPAAIDHLSETGRRFYGIDGSRLEGMIPFSRIENEAEWVSAWEEIKAA